MSTMIIDFGEFNRLTSTAKNLSNKFSKRISDFEGIQKNIDGISSKRNNLDEANYFIKKKTEQYKEKKEKIDNFCNRVADFKAEAENADKRVARRIEIDTKTFRKANNINISVFASLGVAIEEALPWNQISFVRYANSIIESIGTDIKSNIKDWYYNEGGKYIVNIAIDTVLTGLAIAAVIVFPPAGILAAAVAAFSIFNSASSLAYDVMAGYNYLTTKNRTKSDKIDEKGGREVFKNYVSKTASLYGGDEELFANVADIGYTAMSFISAVYTLKSDAKNLKSVFKGFKEFKNLDGSLISKVKSTVIDNIFKTDKDVEIKNVYKLQSTVQKVIPKFSNKATDNLVLLTKYYKNHKTATNLINSINVMGTDDTLDYTKPKLQLPTRLSDILKNGKTTLESIGSTANYVMDNINSYSGIEDDKKQATRIAKVSYNMNFKMPSTLAT